MTGFQSLVKKILPPALVKVLKTGSIRRRQSRFVCHQVRRRHGDRTFTIELVDEKGKGWYDRDSDFDPEILFLKTSRLNTGAVVFDIGAHQGVVAMVLASVVGPHGKVIGIEASPYDAKAAQRNCELNDLKQLTIRNAAISAKPGFLEFQLSGRVSNENDETHTVSVEATTIDGLAKEYESPDVLFIDVDGFEYEALKGAEEVLQSGPDIYMEVHPPYLRDYGATADDVLNVLQKYDYHIFASSVMKPTQRKFVPWHEASVDKETFFHIVAFSKSKLGNAG